jgi:hypothetical protein
MLRVHFAVFDSCKTVADQYTSGIPDNRLRQNDDWNSCNIKFEFDCIDQRIVGAPE